MTIPVSFERPRNGNRYWQVLLYGQVIALCPSEECSLKVATALLKQAEEATQELKWRGK